MCMGEAYSFPTDIWSVGMVLCELASGEYPFANVVNFPQLFEALTENPEPRLDTARYDPAVSGFVAKCLTRDISQRGDVETLLKHEFVQDADLHVAQFAAW